MAESVPGALQCSSHSDVRRRQSIEGRTLMRAFRLFLASSLISLSLLATPACATSYSTDQSDLWYIPTESGWGIQFVQRGNIIFFTMFVYDATGKPIWYVGTISPTANPVIWS